MLTDAQCRNAVCPPDKKRAFFTDAGSLCLEVSPGGSKRWFCKFRKGASYSRMALGSQTRRPSHPVSTGIET